MKIFDKIKNILFEEDEVEIPVITREEPKEEVPSRSFELPKEKEVEEPTKAINLEDTINERELFESKQTFNFPAFTPEKPKEEVKDESLRRTRSLNILDYEKSRKEKNNILRKVDRIDTEEPKRQFKPTPVISPVYGIVDEDYKKEEVKKPIPRRSKVTEPIDIDEVRRKAYGTLEDEIVSTLDKPIEEFYEKKEEPTRSIDELLIDDLDSDSRELYNDVITLPARKEERMDDKLDLLDEIDNNIDEPLSREEEVKKIPVDDTIESDLFKLIDSMYDNGKDGEE